LINSWFLKTIGCSIFGMALLSFWIFSPVWFTSIWHLFVPLAWETLQQFYKPSWTFHMVSNAASYSTWSWCSLKNSPRRILRNLWPASRKSLSTMFRTNWSSISFLLSHCSYWPFTGSVRGCSTSSNFKGSFEAWRSTAEAASWSSLRIGKWPRSGTR